MIMAKNGRVDDVKDFAAPKKANTRILWPAPLWMAPELEQRYVKRLYATYY